MILAEFGKRDCKFFNLYWMEMSIGAGFHLSLPLSKIRYEDAFQYQTINFNLSFLGLMAIVRIPLWKVEEER